MSVYGTRREDLLGGIVHSLTGGRASKVKVSGRARTGATQYDTRTGKVDGIILPREENLPEGCSVDAAAGLLDHEMGHVLFTDVNPADMATGLLQKIANILEDPRIEVRMKARFEGCKETIAALCALGAKMAAEAMPGMTDPLQLALSALSMRAYGEDVKAMMGANPHAGETLAFLEHAQPHIDAALASPDTSGVIAASRKILALLKDPAAHQPQPAPEPEPAPDEDEGEGEGEGGEDSGDGNPDGQDKADGEDGDGGQDESAASGAGDKSGEDDPSGQGEADGEDGSGSAKGDGSETEKDSTGQGGAEGEGDHESGEGDPSGQGESTGSMDGEAEIGDTDPFGKGGAKPIYSDLSDAAEAAENREDFRSFTPAEMVMELLQEAMEQERTIQEAEKMEALKKAQKSGLLCPLNTHPMDWKEREHEQTLGVGRYAQENYSRFVAELRPIIMGIRHALRSHLMAEGRSRTIGGREEGELDSGALYQVALGLSTQVFREVHRGKTNKTAVTILVDQSGSMSGEKEHAARLAAVALHEALNHLPGISTEILGFTYRNGCCHNVAKSFKEKSAIRATSLTAGGGNADGSAVRWAARRSLGFQADRRIMIVLSDGCPTDGPLPDRDLRAAVEAAERHGIETMGIGIMDRSVCAYYPKHVVINRVEDLTGAVLQGIADFLKPKGIAAGKARAKSAQAS